MPKVVLTTLNARYSHTAFGLRYLMANLGDLRQHALLLEFDISRRPADAVEEKSVRKHLEQNRPFGNNDWTQVTAAKLGLEHSLRPRGRPGGWRKRPEKPRKSK